MSGPGASEATEPADPASPRRETGTFVTGSIMRHVVVMTATGSIGLVAAFVVDALNLFYISMLGQQELAAAIGYSGTLLFFTTSVSIGLSIAATALTARALGRGNRGEAREIAGASIVYMLVLTTITAAAAWPSIGFLVHLIGARGETAALATEFLQIVIPSMPVLGVGMCLAALLRATGDARRAMYVTLSGAALTAVLDPLFIFGFELGIHGAAIASVISRFALIVVGFHGLVRVHNLLARPSRAVLLRDYRPYLGIGLPAVMTLVATPVGNTFVTATIAAHGDAAVAGWAVVGRLIPLAFGPLFALSGAVGPILGQNYGARRYDRLRRTMRDSLVFILIYTLVAWAMLALLRNQIADLFGATGEAREVIVFFCLFVAASFIFNGMLFVANAAFNNLGFALYSTVFNWSRSTLGVIPFVWLGSTWYGATGALAGFGLGAVVFGLAAIVVCFRVIGRIGDSDGTPPDPSQTIRTPPAAQSPFTSGKASTL
ncbi:MATE family efflux transporter [Hoeflea olei]|uniref:MATE family efflux transporter n=1 Tax=Hoeflea olei TaxID=1480615 RepID=A0A1C1YUB2_9HYPH|nr:MATE family efflux transporter [Hoeflea olei]OCW57114.1 MATE family efflux transporter [Hoeflea olei]